MSKVRFAITSVLLVLGFGLVAGDCDCDCDESTTSITSAAPVLPPPIRGG